MISILIPFTPDRTESLKKLMAELYIQCGGYISGGEIITGHKGIIMSRNFYKNDVEILLCEDNKQYSIGFKRNLLLKHANLPYLAFIDSDDMISYNYIKTLLNGIETGSDCIGLRGEITIDGGKPEIFEHSLKYKEWKTNEGAAYPNVKYERNPNHLNCIKSSIAKQMKFPETNHGEDHDYSKQLHASGLLKTEYEINHVIYFYNYISKK